MSHLVRSLAALAACAFAFAGCATDRYVGAISPQGIYGNRGFGFVLDWTAPRLKLIWRLLDPKGEGRTQGEQQAIIDGPLDLDGDGVFSQAETVRFVRPMLRLVAKETRTTSIALARIDIDVAILGGEASQKPLDEITQEALAELFGVRTSTAQLEPRRLGPDFDARVVEGRAEDRPYRLAVIDQAGFHGEGGAIRRQVVRVALFAAKIEPPLRADFNEILASILLNRRGAPPTRQEEW